VNKDTLSGVRRVVLVLAISCCVTLSAQPPAAHQDALPQNLDDFRAAVKRVLDETGVPGAGIALVRSDGIEWEGGVGVADRERGTSVTAATHFRVGSISKTFVAAALVQLYEDGEIDFDAPIHDIAPDIAIDNPWEDSDPVRVVHVLQHTAGFDDMHLNEIYVPEGEAELSLEDVLKRNPSSRRVRWRPGTRMAYSNPGYAVAGRLIEKITGEPYEDYIEREIFDPLQMTTSSFRLTESDEALLAKGYDSQEGPAVPFRRIYLRPAGNMHSSAHEMGRFVQMVLGWGELGTAFIIDPEYLGNMEQPRTTLASQAGLRNGYGSGISMRLDLPFKVLGHGGGIEGFLSSYGYSPSRDVGYVVLLNSTGPRASEAIDRLSSLAIRYLKRDIEPPVKPEATLDAAALDRYVGYYREANPRNQLLWSVQSLLSGMRIVRDGTTLYAQPVMGPRVRLVPVTESTFRRDDEIDASRVFTRDRDGTMVMTGAQVYAEQVPRWRAELVRVPVLAAVPVIASVFIVAIVWIARIRRAQPRGFWELKIALLLCPIALLLPVIGLSMTPVSDMGTQSAGTAAVFVGTLAVPTLGLAVAVLTTLAMRAGASRALTTYAATVALAMGGLSLYLSSQGLLGLRTWTY
jgi:CubicO group peptidase (beta-lactamase class C family)